MLKVPCVYILRFSCPDRLGITAAATEALSRHCANIVEAHQYNDVDSVMFFSRIAFVFQGVDRICEVSDSLKNLAQQFDMKHSVTKLSDKRRVLLLLSRFDHCLADLLYRWRLGELNMTISGIVSNYPRETYLHHDFGDIPFYYLPVTKDTKAGQEERLWTIVDERKVDLVVLARYMQILSPELATKLAGRCINIHHSFLPGFKGARPYHQAHARGVKLIGATAHYVTDDLDEGPIIEQDVERVSHFDTPDTLIRKGRDIERRVLSRAVHWHLEDRVIQNGAKTVVFRD